VSTIQKKHNLGLTGHSISFVISRIPNEAPSMTDEFGLCGQNRILNNNPKIYSGLLIQAGSLW
jgi:hypothetical protein